MAAFLSNVKYEWGDKECILGKASKLLLSVSLQKKKGYHFLIKIMDIT